MEGKWPYFSARALRDTAGRGCRHVSKVHLYKPMSASLLQQIVQWVSGAPPEFTDQKFPAAGYGREVRLVCASVRPRVNDSSQPEGAFGSELQMAVRLIRRAVAHGSSCSRGAHVTH